MSLGAVGTHVRVRLFYGGENGTEVDPVGFPVIDGLLHLERVHAADHFIDRAKAKRGHDLACFLGDHEKIIDHMLRIAGEFLAQLRILCGDAHGTGIEVALAHHDATHGDERRGGETHFLRTKQRGDNHIAAGLEAAVSLQHHTAAEVVEHQRLVCLGDAQFPR